MRFTAIPFLCIALLFTIQTVTAQKNISGYDVVVYGGTSAGVIAAYSAKQMGKSVLLIEPGKRVGGLTSGGLGFTDIGNKYAISGLALDFYRRVGAHYGKFEQWIFEPSVAERIYQQYIKKANLSVLYSYRITSAKKTGTAISEITIENSESPAIKTNKTISGKMFIDASYEGDLMAKAGVSYTVGREDNNQYNETVNGVQLKHKHQFPDGIDPYNTPGKPESGLLWGVSTNTIKPNGTGNKMVQAYNFRICLTRDAANRIEITKPADYDSTHYELLVRLIEKQAVKNIGDMMKFDIMPNNKTDINNNGPFSTDMIGMNWDYPDANYIKRAEIQKAHESYTKGLLYFVGHDAKVPENIRKEMLKWGYPKDEYPDNGNFTPQMYIREARRMVGSYVMTQANCFADKQVKDGVGMAAYKMDSHNSERLVINGMVKNEGDVQFGEFGPYPIAYSSLIPKANECSNLLVPVCMSASHIAYGSIRMEPVFMNLGQSCGMAASMAIDDKTSLQKLNIAKLQQLLKTNPLADGSTADILIDNSDKDAVILNGEWKEELNSKGCYGPSVYVNYDKTAKDSYARFTPKIIKGGNYKIYAYISKNKGTAPEVFYKIHTPTQDKEASIKIANVNIHGQTSGEWVYITDSNLQAGKSAYVDIVKKDNDTFVLADAILFVPDSRH
jgi:hypothetical protein